MATLASLAPHRFVSLTTFRRSGEPVATPVWVVGDGADLLVLTPAGTGKLRRLRRDPRVEVRPCTRQGRVHTHAPVAAGHAEVVTDPAAVDSVRERLHAKYGREYTIFMAVEKLARRGASPERVVIRIRPA